jgi:hypothetical protein
MREGRRGEPAIDEQPELVDGWDREHPGMLEVGERSADGLIGDAHPGTRSSFPGSAIMGGIVGDAAAGAAGESVRWESSAEEAMT